MNTLSTETQLGNRDAILIDMDGVLVDPLQRAIDNLNELGYSLQAESVKDYKLTGLPRAALLEQYRSPGFYRNLPVIEGAVNGINRLREENDDNVFMWSKVQEGSDGSEEDKREQLCDIFGDEFARRAIIRANKIDGVNGLVGIEDNPDIAYDRENLPQLVMFDRTYNRMATQYLRMHGWGEHGLQVVRYAIESARTK